MPLRLIPPRPGKTPYWGICGKHLGRYVSASTKARDRRLATKVMRKWEREIERGEFTEPEAATFASAVVAYLQAGGDRRPLAPLIEHFKETPLARIDQAAIDAAAAALFPDLSPATRNREVYTPVSAVLKAAGVDFKIRRPKGSRGRVITRWLWPEQAFAIFAAARSIDEEFAIFLELLCYTGCRLSDLLLITCDDVRLAESFAFIRSTKNGDPRPVFLPDYAVCALRRHPRGLARGAERVFRFHKGGSLYHLLDATRKVASGLPMPKRIKRGKRPLASPYKYDWVNFHTFCHTWATWMRRYAGLDTKGLVGTGRWRDEQSASRYQHVVVSEEARKATLLPVPSGSLEMTDASGNSTEKHEKTA